MRWLGILQLPFRARGCPAEGPWGQVGDGLRALEAAVPLAQGLHAGVWPDGKMVLNNSVKIFISSVTL